MVASKRLPFLRDNYLNIVKRGPNNNGLEMFDGALKVMMTSETCGQDVSGNVM